MSATPVPRITYYVFGSSSPDPLAVPPAPGSCCARAGRRGPGHFERAYLRQTPYPQRPPPLLGGEHPLVVAKRASALDVSRPGLLDQLDDRFRHRNVVEFFSHLVALLECPLEELDGFLRG